MKTKNANLIRCRSFERIISSGVCIFFAGYTAGLTAPPAAAELERREVRVLDDAQRLEQWEGYRQARDEGRIIYVAGDGSGDFNCDGTDDQEEINAALEMAALAYAADAPWFVHLKGPHTYVISDTIKVGDNTVLQGDADAVVKLKDNVQWPRGHAMIASRHMRPTREHPHYTGQNPEPIRNVVIRGFEMDANAANNRGTCVETGARRDVANAWDQMIMLINAYDITINDMYLHDMLCDGILIRVLGGEGPAINSRFFNNRIDHCGHDSFYMQNVSHFEIFNNSLYGNRWNSMIRVDVGSDYAIYGNLLHNDRDLAPTANAGVQVNMGARSSDNVRIYENEISRMGLGGIIITGRAPFGELRGFHIHNNIIYDCHIAGIRVLGAHNTLIENNVLYGIRGDGILHWHIYSLEDGGRVERPPEGEKYTTIVRNNIIVNSVLHDVHRNPDRHHPYFQPEAGFGLNNCKIHRSEEPGVVSPHLSGLHQFISDNNCIYNNESGPYNNVSSDTDIHLDPLFVDAEGRDFRLRPDSPCIGAGTDGGNIGAY